ncbi:hypothetical protein [Planotetraspora sp. GP83]|uniref:hypothetical protein n=1 Tax=Planotetraspora sp. GP83 TaxID=3156264 RepID=UPI003513D40E
MRRLLVRLLCVLTLAQAAFIGATPAGAASSLRYLSSFGDYDKVAGTIVLRANECPANDLFQVDTTTGDPIHLHPACVTDNGRTQLKLTIDTTTLVQDHPYVINLYGGTWQLAGQAMFTPHNPQPAAPKSLSKGVYVTGGWADTPVAGAFSYIEDGGKIPNWVQGIAIEVAWRTLQDSSPAALDTSRIDEALAYAKGHAAEGRSGPLPVIFIIKQGDDATPLWFVEDTTDGFGERVVSYLGGPDAFGFTPWDKLAGDMFNNMTARLAAKFDQDANFGGIYLGGAGTPRYPEMWYPKFTGCNGRYGSDVGGGPGGTQPDGIPKAGEFTWSTDCPSNSANPGLQADAWKGTYALMTSQFRSTPLIGMLDVTRENDASMQRTTTAMSSILEGITLRPNDSVGVTNMRTHTFDQADTRDYANGDWQKYNTINVLPSTVFRLNEVDPRFYNDTGSTNAAAYMPANQSEPAGGDYARWLQNVVQYCGDNTALPEPNGAAQPFSVKCDAVLVHRTNLDANFFPHQWVFDTCTLREASEATWHVGGAGSCGTPAAAQPPVPPIQ